jgi:hypothetical protein
MSPCISGRRLFERSKPTLAIALIVDTTGDRVSCTRKQNRARKSDFLARFEIHQRCRRSIKIYPGILFGFLFRFCRPICGIQPRSPSCQWHAEFGMRSRFQRIDFHRTRCPFATISQRVGEIEFMRFARLQGQRFAPRAGRGLSFVRERFFAEIRNLDPCQPIGYFDFQFKSCRRNREGPIFRSGTSIEAAVVPLLNVFHACLN